MSERSRDGAGTGDSLDAALRADLLLPPPDFAARVMAALDERPLPAAAAAQPAPARRRPDSQLAREAAQWLALAGAVVTGMAQLLPLLFGLWTFTNAG